MPRFYCPIMDSFYGWRTVSGDPYRMNGNYTDYRDAANVKRLKISLRNQLKGRVTDVKMGQINAQVTIDIGCGNTVISTITIVSLNKLGIRVGSTVFAVIKSTDVSLESYSGTTANMNMPSTTQLKGNVININQGIVDAQVNVDIGCGNMVSVVTTVSSLEDLGIKVGSPVIALIKASNVMLVA